MNRSHLFFALPITLFLLLGASIVTVTHATSPENTGTHVSMYYNDNRDFFEDSLRPFASTDPVSPRPRIFITNQHVLAASLIAHQFALAQDPSVMTVVLITQNNWDAGTSAVITSKDNWKTPLGDVSSEHSLTDELVSQKLASVDEDVFIHEHGITGIIPYVAYAFPSAKVVPLVIRDKTPDAILDALAQKLGALDLSRTVIIGTIDMSHYLPKYLSDEHDRKTEQAITAFDYQTLPRLDIDTAPTLRVVMKVAEHARLQRFVETGHANSADITSQPDLLSTTSYITGYFAPGLLQANSEPVHLLFTGDVMLDRNVASHARTAGDDVLFKNIERMFLGTDVVTINHEGTETHESSIAAVDNSKLQFTFDPHFAGFLSGLGINAASLSNNHTFDYGQDGFESTKTYLGRAGITTFGSPHNDDELSSSLSVHGKKICFVGYEEFVQPALAPFTAEIARIRPTCDYIVATMHAGVEYQSGYTMHQQVIARAFIDAGADLVIGTHPHVVEPLEIYKGKAIFYSLGNFLFDQNFSFATTHGLTVHVEWSDADTRFILVPVDVKGEEVSFSTPEERRQTFLPLMNSSLPSDIASSILSSYSFTLPN